MVDQPLGQAGRQHELAVGDGDEAVAERMEPEFRPARLADARLISYGAEALVFWALQRLASRVASKNVQLITRRDNLKLSHGATGEARENAVKQDRVQATNAIGIAWKGLKFYTGRNL